MDSVDLNAYATAALYEKLIRIDTSDVLRRVDGRVSLAAASTTAWSASKTYGPWISSPQREPYRVPLKGMLAYVCREWVKSDGNVMEVGAGKLDDLGRSHLAVLLPTSIGDRLRYVDANPACAADATRFPTRTYLMSLAERLLDKVDRASQDAIFACCSLDTIRRGELGRAIKEIHGALKPGGTLVSVSDMHPETTSIMDAFVTEGKLIFPGRPTNMEIWDIRVISPDDLRAYLSDRAVVLDPTERKVLEYYLSKQPNETERIVNTLHGDAASGSGGAFNTIRRMVERLKIPGMQTIDLNEHYHPVLRKALEDAGFAVRLYDSLKTTYCYQPEQMPEDNDYEIAPEATRSHRNYVLSPGLVRITLSVHFVVAQKL